MTPFCTRLNFERRVKCFTPSSRRILGSLINNQNKYTERMKQTAVYRITFPNGAFYIGASLDYPARWAKHRFDARNGAGANSALKKAFADCQNPAFKVVELTTPNNLRRAESAAIKREKPTLNHFEQTYFSVSALCRKYGTQLPIYTYRRKLGWTVRQSLGLDVPPPRKKKKANPMRLIDIGGKVRTVLAWAAERGMPLSTAYTRLRNGWSPEEALGFCERQPIAGAAQKR